MAKRSVPGTARWACYFFVGTVQRTNEQCFKVGYTDNVAGRAKTVARAAGCSINRARSWAYYFPTKKMAIDCETMVKACCMSGELRGLEKGDGCSEWFPMRSLYFVERLMESQKKQLGWEEKVVGEGIFERGWTSLNVRIPVALHQRLEMALIDVGCRKRRHVIPPLIEQWVCEVEAAREAQLRREPRHEPAKLPRSAKRRLTAGRDRRRSTPTDD